MPHATIRPHTHRARLVVPRKAATAERAPAFFVSFLYCSLVRRASWSHALCGRLPDHYFGFLDEAVRRDFEVERGGPLADAAAGVVVGAVAGAKPAAVLARAGNGHAAEVGANGQAHQPLGLREREKEREKKRER